MVKKQMEEDLTKARDILNQSNQLGDTAYDMADGIMYNMKAFVHDEVTRKRVTDYEEKIIKEFSKKISEARTKLKDNDPLFAWKTGVGFYMDLRQWKTLEMLNFWDNLLKTQDI